MCHTGGKFCEQWRSSAGIPSSIAWTACFPLSVKEAEEGESSGKATDNCQRQQSGREATLRGWIWLPSWDFTLFLPFVFVYKNKHTDLMGVELTNIKLKNPNSVLNLSFSDYICLPGFSEKLLINHSYRSMTETHFSHSHSDSQSEIPESNSNLTS